MAQLHFISGKGGVGKSTFAAALAMQLAQRREGPVLLLEVQGSGRSLQLCGLQGPKPYENTVLPDLPAAWGARLLPKETFRQYFSLLLSLGDQMSTFAAATSTLRERLVDVVFENKVVAAFIDVCPGLEPAVLLGKIHWEATVGRVPESREPWRHVVVDGPATGHGLMLFKSTNALTEVFGSGLIFKQASEIMRFVRNPTQTQVYVVTAPEELPIRETLDMSQSLAQMNLASYAFVMNRCSPRAEQSGTCNANAEWQREIAFERESARDQLALIESFRTQVATKSKLWLLPEIYSDDPAVIARTLAKELPQ
ncbi:MAG: P-loop NTPase [Bdellovibrionales bacterium]|nr:P-loop NTPase [Bdellovibrionales bacterium]